MKRVHHQMIEPATVPVNINGVGYHDFSSHMAYYQQPPAQAHAHTHTHPHTPPPQQQPHSVVFNNPFPSPSEYDGYHSNPNASMGQFTPNRALSEPFVHHPGGHPIPSSGPSSTNVSFGPMTPPTTLPSSRLPLMPISPSRSAQSKNKRISVACEECRKRKQKCDGQTDCAPCKEQKLKCVYRDQAPTKKDNTFERIEKLMEDQAKKIQGLQQSMDKMSARLAKLEQLEAIEKYLKSFSEQGGIICNQCRSPMDLETGDYCETSSPKRRRM